MFWVFLLWSFVGLDLRGPVLRKSESLNPEDEDGIEEERPREEAKEATSDLILSMSSRLFEGFFDFDETAIIACEAQTEGFKALS